MPHKYLAQTTKLQAYIPVETEKKKTILLVEDEKEVREVLKEYLELSGYRVLPAASFYDAMNLFTKNEQIINLLVSDLSLEGFNGIELAKVLITINPKISVLLMSGNPQWFQEKTGLLLSRVDFIEKPFNFNRLIEKVEKLTGTLTEKKLLP